MWLINGEWQTQIAASDRATQFGDGCFTTARIVDGKVRFADDHLKRLAQGCERLGIPMPDEEILAREMCELAQGEARATLKVMITRGEGGRGYSALGCDRPSRLLHLAPWPMHYEAWRNRGIRLALSPVPLGCNPWLAGIKHLNRLEQVLIRAHLEQTTADEALVLDSDGWLTECCAANLFWRKGTSVFTPVLDRAGVNGTMRQRIMRLLEASGWQIHEVRERPETLANADEVLVCNALMPVLPVQQAEQWRYSSRELYQFLLPGCE
ncbi:aminodeoxychorismate lyase [Enterobacteriaceae bacterium BIT-l23]|uniref:Aminodeoxychorismate lyase n=1 Tax=Jejubacter calystegiae TaxID=2579935 RepID=A0A4P8YMN6_9ENTR|nr:aminodeoxychorismate lyase [Jejubacter calystegiae]NUU65424.1 aminodeoxychorismate lyase [Enterobacteriaceae bacterium BIT-l23]QCT20954.1 aminodeoxychorismate lyase [Jejubacter calystegiae]